MRASLRSCFLLLALAAGPAAAQISAAPGVTVYPPGTMGPGISPAIQVQPAPAQMSGFPESPMPPSQPSNPVSAPSADFQEDVPTANEQGFGQQTDLEAYARAMADQTAMSTPRQKGLVVPAPRTAFPVAKDPAAREWLANWEYTLTHMGMSSKKVRFEAARLDRVAFEAWASRQYWHRQPQVNRVKVLERPTCPAAGC